jgi:hypothetical protein
MNTLEMNKLMLGGNPQNMSGFVEGIANKDQKEAAKAAAALATKKCKFAEMPSLSLGLNIWSRYDTKKFASLTKVVHRL